MEREKREKCDGSGREWECGYVVGQGLDVDMVGRWPLILFCYGA